MIESKETKTRGIDGCAAQMTCTTGILLIKHMSPIACACSYHHSLYTLTRDRSTPRKGCKISLSKPNGYVFFSLCEFAVCGGLTRRLNKESRQPACDRSKATRVMRLMENGEVDGKHWAQACKQLHRNLKADAVWSGTTSIQHPQPVYPDRLC